jgi:hypothetical protein
LKGHTILGEVSTYPELRFIGVHVFIDLATLPLGLAVALPHLALVFFYRHSFAGVLQRTARPAQH